MTLETARTHKDHALNLRRESKFEEAGEQYLLASFEYLGVDVSTPPGPSFCRGVEQLLYATTCFRLADQRERTRTYAEIGILVAAEMFRRLEAECDRPNSYDQARVGSWHEYIGDLRQIARLGNPDEAYDRAKEIYRAAGDPPAVLAEWEHMYLMRFFVLIEYNAVGHTEHYDVPDRSLTEWVKHKRDRLGGYLETIDQQKQLSTTRSEG